jgi:hypothetical protein
MFVQKDCDQKFQHHYFLPIEPIRPQLKIYMHNQQHGSSVAAWLSETVLRGRGPGASGFESHRRGRNFSKEGTSAGPWMCVSV